MERAIAPSITRGRTSARRSTRCTTRFWHRLARWRYSVADAFAVPKRAMAVFAHPDDVDFGCSGTLAGFIERGTHVTYCLLTSGDKGTHDPKMLPETLAETREKEQRAAGEAIGVKDAVFLRRRAGERERTMALREEVCLAIRVHKPDLVFTNDPWSHYQIHPDHRVAGWSGMDGVIAARDHPSFLHHVTGD